MVSDPASLLINVDATSFATRLLSVGSGVVGAMVELVTPCSNVWLAIIKSFANISPGNGPGDEVVLSAMVDKGTNVLITEVVFIPPSVVKLTNSVV